MSVYIIFFPLYWSAGWFESLLDAHFRKYSMSQRTTKPTKWYVRPMKTQISLGICLVWSESSLCAQWVAKDLNFLHADSKDWSDWADAGLGAHDILKVLSCAGSNICMFSDVATRIFPQTSKTLTSPDVQASGRLWCLSMVLFWFSCIRAYFMQYLHLFQIISATIVILIPERDVVISESDKRVSYFPFYYFLGWNLRY